MFSRDHPNPSTMRESWVRFFLDRRDDAWLAAFGAPKDEVETDERLADASRAADEGRRAGQVAIPQELVERVDTGRLPLRAQRVVGAIERIGQPRKDMQAGWADAIGMLPGGDTAASQFENLQNSSLPFRRRVGCVILANPERRRRQRRQASGEVVKKAPELALIGRKLMQRLEAVDRHQARVILLDKVVDPRQHSRQTVIRQDIPQVLIEHAFPDCLRIEEFE